MKTHTKGHYILKGILFGIFAISFFSAILMLLWNWLMPSIFGLTEIHFWQALGLLVLSKIVFSGGHPGGHHFHRYNREKYLKERFHKRMEYAKAHFAKEPSEREN